MSRGQILSWHFWIQSKMAQKWSGTQRWGSDCLIISQLSWSHMSSSVLPIPWPYTFTFQGLHWPTPSWQSLCSLHLSIYRTCLTSIVFQTIQSMIQSGSWTASCWIFGDLQQFFATTLWLETPYCVRSYLTFTFCFKPRLGIIYCPDFYLVPPSRTCCVGSFISIVCESFFQPLNLHSFLPCDIHMYQVAGLSMLYHDLPYDMYITWKSAKP
jgi:hypothetical protein